uniref:Reverse transcriptase domain-containing protein n=1 Tax=Strongyloides venezuelensis TaxID=75913 RepID=A0A0K0FRZ4_STRVS
MDPFEVSSGESDGIHYGIYPNSQRRKSASKSSNHHVDYMQSNKYETAITGVITSDKIAARNAMKSQTLSHPVRLRQINENVMEKENNPVPSFTTQGSNLSSGSQSHSVLISQESSAMNCCHLNWKTCKIILKYDHYAKIKTLIEDNFQSESKADNERLNAIISALDNLSIEPPTKRKVSKKVSESETKTGTWLVSVGGETKPLYLVCDDVMIVVVSKARKFLVSVNRAPEAKLRQFLDTHIDINTIVKRVGRPHKLGMTVADYLFPKDVQVAFKFHNSLTRSSKRQALPDEKMKKYKQALMYCRMSCFYAENEKNAYYSAVIESLNGRASHWGAGSQRKSYNSDYMPTYWDVSDFPLPVNVPAEVSSQSFAINEDVSET